MWNNPHLLIMDEPTNYLDRVSGMKEERGGGAMQ
jgi:ATPase subunit of ABC transporter with duplicated ATPase domains